MYSSLHFCQAGCHQTFFERRFQNLIQNSPVIAANYRLRFLRLVSINQPHAPVIGVNPKRIIGVKVGLRCKIASPPLSRWFSRPHKVKSARRSQITNYFLFSGWVGSLCPLPRTTGGSSAALCSPHIHVASELLCFIRRTQSACANASEGPRVKSLHPYKGTSSLFLLVIPSYMFHTLTQYWANYRYADFATETD